ncbi:MAG: hypothetical protein QGI86_07010 [Candidatus Poribacteria bacterium]|jgi:hypothetical protein|nr:hypothetical protein [Candidatus Poribacteria bacterium]MDP6748687.1 hypothetical protein [Candidatus Poribacteria bacterium]
MEIVSLWVIAFFSLCIFSYLYRNNPFYKFAIHVILGLMVGYMFLQQVTIGLEQLVVSPILEELGRPSPDAPDILIQRVLPLLVASLIFTIFVPERRWLSRIPIGLLLGYGMGYMLTKSLEADVFKQLNATLTQSITAISGDSIFRSRWPAWGQFLPGLSALTVIGLTIFYRFRMQHPTIRTIIYIALSLFICSLADSIMILVGVLTVLSYFFFSFERRGLVEEVSRVGLVFMMVYFGAVFGNTVLTRIQIFIGQVDFLIFKWLGGTWQALFRG